MSDPKSTNAERDRAGLHKSCCERQVVPDGVGLLIPWWRASTVRVLQSATVTLVAARAAKRATREYRGEGRVRRRHDVLAPQRRIADPRVAERSRAHEPTCRSHQGKACCHGCEAKETSSTKQLRGACERGQRDDDLGQQGRWARPSRQQADRPCGRRGGNRDECDSGEPETKNVSSQVHGYTPERRLGAPGEFGRTIDHGRRSRQGNVTASSSVHLSAPRRACV